MRLFTARQGIAQQCTRGEEHRPLFSIRAMCRSLRDHPSGFYAWLKSPLGKRAVEDQRQTKLIKEAWKESGKVYGYRKLHDDLCDQGDIIIEQWRKHYNTRRPHSALGYRPPAPETTTPMDQRWITSRDVYSWGSS